MSTAKHLNEEQLVRTSVGRDERQGQVTGSQADNEELLQPDKEPCPVFAFCFPLRPAPSRSGLPGDSIWRGV